MDNSAAVKIFNGLRDRDDGASRFHPRQSPERLQSFDDAAPNCEIHHQVSRAIAILDAMQFDDSGMMKCANGVDNAPMCSQRFRTARKPIWQALDDDAALGRRIDRFTRRTPREDVGDAKRADDGARHERRRGFH